MIAKPTPAMLRWADLELGLFFHFDIQVFDTRWSHESRGPLPPAQAWNPRELETEQWLRTAVAAGARYALLTAKHSTGFCLWPTAQHDYHVGNALVRRDVVGEFVASCRRHGVEPGLYYSLNGQHLIEMFTDDDGVLDRDAFNRTLLAQVEELVTGYGPLCEIWFDGGVLRPERDGPDIPGLINRIAPELPCFGGPPGVRNVIRWSGSEQGVATPECWSTAHFLTDEARDNVTCDSPGDPDDPVWAPVEVDIPSRDVLTAWMGGWMYHDDDACRTYSGEYLFARYLTSVGRNANLVIGCVPDRDGLISQDQVEAFTDLGGRIDANLGTPLRQARTMSDDWTIEVRFDAPVDASFVEIEEDQSGGQLILAWTLELMWPRSWNEISGHEVWFPVAEGRSIGHKRIVQLNVLRGTAFRVRATESQGTARFRAMRIYGRPTDC